MATGRRQSSASGSKSHRAALYCRQADSAAAVLPNLLLLRRPNCKDVRTLPVVTDLQSVARCSRFAISCVGSRSRHAGFNPTWLPVAARARPPAVRTTAQPYTAGRPTPPATGKRQKRWICSPPLISEIHLRDETALQTILWHIVRAGVTLLLTPRHQPSFRTPAGHIDSAGDFHEGA